MRTTPPPGPGPRAGTTVLLVDDHRVFTDVLRLGIESEPDLRCVGVAHSAREGLARAAATGFDVAVIDLELPDGSGLDLVAGLLALRPAARVLVLTAYARPESARRALQDGAAGVMGKETALRDVLQAVRTATPARPVMPPGLDRTAGVRVELTPREHDVLRQLGLGLEAYRIAEVLGISLYTTRDHIKTLMRKLGAHSQLGAVVEAERLGLLSVGRAH